MTASMSRKSRILWQQYSLLVWQQRFTDTRVCLATSHGCHEQQFSPPSNCVSTQHVSLAPQKGPHVVHQHSKI